MKNRDTLIKQLSYQSTHRGCKETDIILGTFAENDLMNLSDEELLEYQQILAIDDAVFYNWFAGISDVMPVTFKTEIFKKIKNAKICS